MKSKTLTYIAAMTLFAVLAIPVRLAAQGQKQAPPRYTVTDLGTLGGGRLARLWALTTKPRSSVSRRCRETRAYTRFFGGRV